MIPTTTSTDPLVEALATRLRRMDLVGWQRIATWAKQAELSFEDLRLLSEQGQELVANLDAAHREGIQAYVDQLSPDESRRLEAAFAISR